MFAQTIITRNMCMIEQIWIYGKQGDLILYHIILF